MTNDPSAHIFLSTETDSSENVEKSLPVISGYKLLQEIGAGGMGQVWMADELGEVHRRVAIKIIQAGVGGKEVIARFEAERQALAMMNHPNIATFFKAGSLASGEPFFVMELINGTPITEYCDKNLLTVRERLRLFCSVCEGVQHAHQKGIIHRDIKPSNILVTQCDGDPIPKIIDFGLAKAIQPQIRLTEKTLFTQFQQVAGTLLYMSPEQTEMNSLAIDTRTDIYSLGVLLFELITGTTPIQKEALQDNALLKILELVRQYRAPRPSIRLSESGEQTQGISQQRQQTPKGLGRLVTGDLDQIVLKALDNDRQRRYQTAIGFAEDISRFLDGEPVKAKPPSLWYHTQKFVGRNRVLCALSFLLLFSLVFGLIFVTQQMLKNAKLAENLKVANTQAQQEKSKLAVANQSLGENKASLKRELRKTRLLQYSNQIYQAQHAWNNHKPKQAFDLLDSCDWDLRDWEHDYLYSEFTRGLIPNTPHQQGWIRLVKTSASQQCIVTLSKDQIATWDQSTAKILSQVDVKEAKQLEFVDDQKQILVATPKTLHIFKIPQLELIRKIEIPPYAMFAKIPKTNKLLFAGLENQFKKFDFATGESKVLVSDTKANIKSITVDSTGKSFAVGGDGKNTPGAWIQIRSTETGELLREAKLKNNWATEELKFISTDLLAISTTMGQGGWEWGRKIHLLNVDSGSITTRHVGNQDEILKIKIYPEARIGASCDQHGVSIWPLDPGSANSSQSFFRIDSPFDIDDFSLDSSTLRLTIFGLRPTNIPVKRRGFGPGPQYKHMSYLMIKDLLDASKIPNWIQKPSRRQVEKTDVGESSLYWQKGFSNYRRIHLLNEGEWILTSCGEIVDAKSFKKEFGVNIEGGPRIIAVNDKQTLIAVGASDGSVSVFNAKTGELLQKLDYCGTGGAIDPARYRWVSDIQFFFDDKRIAIGNIDGSVYIYDLARSKLLKKIKVVDNGQIHEIAVSKDDNYIACRASDGAYLIDLQSAPASILEKGFYTPYAHYLGADIPTMRFAKNRLETLRGNYDLATKQFYPTTFSDLLDMRLSRNRITRRWASKAFVVKDSEFDIQVLSVPNLERETNNFWVEKMPNGSLLRTGSEGVQIFRADRKMPLSPKSFKQLQSFVRKIALQELEDAKNAEKYCRELLAFKNVPETQLTNGIVQYRISNFRRSFLVLEETLRNLNAKTTKSENTRLGCLTFLALSRKQMKQLESAQQWANKATDLFRKTSDQRKLTEEETAWQKLLQSNFAD